MIQHQIFGEKVNSALVKAGLPIASTFDASLSSGAYLEIVDDERLPPEAFLKWRVHPVLHNHFRSVPHDQLESDPQVMEMINAESAMNIAIRTILEFSGFKVREARGERAGELLVGEPDMS